MYRICDGQVMTLEAGSGAAVGAEAPMSTTGSKGDAPVVVYDVARGEHGHSATPTRSSVAAAALAAMSSPLPVLNPASMGDVTNRCLPVLMASVFRRVSAIPESGAEGLTRELTVQRTR